MKNNLENLKQRFRESFPKADSPRIFFAPGRVNLIGEHTDYTGGFVMPLALDLGITMLISPSTDGRYRLISEDFDNIVDFDGKIEFQKDDPWGNYPKGIVKELITEGLKFKGYNVLYHSTLPLGAGLSSSAALGMVTAFALSALNDLGLDRERLAFLCQRMENDFIGVKSGIMDQFAVGLSKKDHALFLNCQSMEWDYVPLNLDGIKIVITNTGKKRGLNESRYNERRVETETALEKLRELKPILGTYQDLTLNDLPLINSLSYPYRERARHIVTENNRVLKAKEALINGNMTEFGQLMLASHRSLSLDFEVTGKELDSLFKAQLEAGCFRTRMTGAGFGGCTVSLVDENSIETFKEVSGQSYTEKTGLVPEFYVATSDDGVREI